MGRGSGGRNRVCAREVKEGAMGAQGKWSKVQGLRRGSGGRIKRFAGCMEKEGSGGRAGSV